MDSAPWRAPPVETHIREVCAPLGCVKVTDPRLTTIAAQHHLPSDWLNDGVKGLLPDKVAPLEGTSSFSAPGIHVGVASAEYLFAMKAMAARQETDGDDLRLLAQRLGLHSTQHALDLVERFYGRDRLGPKTKLILEALISDGSAG